MRFLPQFSFYVTSLDYSRFPTGEARVAMMNRTDTTELQLGLTCNLN